MLGYETAAFCEETLVQYCQAGESGGLGVIGREFSNFLGSLRSASSGQVWALAQTTTPPRGCVNKRSPRRPTSCVFAHHPTLRYLVLAVRQACCSSNRCSLEFFKGRQIALRSVFVGTSLRVLRQESTQVKEQTGKGRLQHPEHKAMKGS